MRFTLLLLLLFVAATLLNPLSAQKPKPYLTQAKPSAIKSLPTPRPCAAWAGALACDSLRPGAGITNWKLANAQA